MISILTDFGDSAYVGVMKAVILSHAPKARITDLAHNIKPQAVRQAGWVLKTTYSYFPKGTIFLCVIDPGVGTDRNPIAVKTKNYSFVGPDNGLMWPTIEEDGFEGAVELPTEGSSKTFEGRDVFAVAAGKLEAGKPLSKVGKPIKKIEKLEFLLNGRKGEIVSIDRFGNIITNLPPVKGKKVYNVSTPLWKRKIRHMETYEHAPDGELILITSSAGTLEISLKNANASEQAPLKPGHHVMIE